MLWTVAIILVVLWLIGFITSYTFGGFIHILLVIAVIVIVVNLIQGRRRQNKNLKRIKLFYKDDKRIKLTNKIGGVIADHLVHPNHVKADGLHFLIPPSC